MEEDETQKEEGQDSGCEDEGWEELEEWGEQL